MVRRVWRSSGNAKWGFWGKVLENANILSGFSFMLKKTCNTGQRNCGRRKRWCGCCLWANMLTVKADQFLRRCYRPEIWRKKSSECVSPFVTVSCCSDARFSPAETAAGPLSLGSSFAPRTYRHTETVAEIMVKDIKHTQTSTWQEWRWHKHWVLLCFLCLCEFNDCIHWISSFPLCLGTKHNGSEWGQWGVGKCQLFFKVISHTHICFFCRHAIFTMLFPVTSGLQLRSTTDIHIFGCLPYLTYPAQVL